MSPQVWPPIDRVQRGQVVSAASPVTVTFPAAFDAPPRVTVQAVSTGATVAASVQDITTTGCKVNAYGIASAAWAPGFAVLWEARPA